MRKIGIAITLVYLFSTWLSAQHSLVYTNKDMQFNQGKELYNQRKYAASYRSFEAFLKSTSALNAGQIQEAEYYMAANAYRLSQTDAASKLTVYLAQHPYTPFEDMASFMLGMLEFKQKKYANALKYFNAVNEKRLGKYEKVDFLFSKGFASLQTKNYNEALTIFKQLKEMNTRYDLAATYYYAYTQYSLGNYEAALPDFLKLESNPAYKKIVPYYILQIYYAQKKYDMMNERADLLLKSNPTNPNNAEIYRIMGEIAYEKKDYAKAISNLKNYEKNAKQVLRNDMYILGLALYQNKDYKGAIQRLQKTTTEKDALTENAYLHLGNANVKLNNKTNARLAYEAALRTNFNADVREEAMYSYALTTYESTSAFGESISAFNQFLSEFPNSKHTNNAQNYLANVFFTTKNYETAYEAIQKIKNPNSRLVEARQYLLYQIGTEAFTQQNHSKAIEYFNLSLQSSPNGKYAAESLYWRSEAYFLTAQPEKSIANLQNFFRNPYAKTSANFKTANYGMAYAHFSRKNYGEALMWFLKYADIETNNRAGTYTDALNRIGDCYFNARNFPKAEAYYSKAAELSPNTGDYALFQSAYVAGLQKNYNGKILRLENLLTKYPRSEYADASMYEIGRAYIMLENDAKALDAFKRLLNNKPSSPSARKAALDIGMIYYNQSNYDEAIKAYKRVISNYPSSEEAQTALESLESVYVDKNDVASYLAYTKTLGLKIANNNANREDSISYIAAERQYMIANYNQAISGFSSYIKSFCAGGRYCSNAQYYLADSYYKTNEKDKALTAYQALLQINGNQFEQDAVMRCAEITYDKKDYTSSLQYFKQLQNIAPSADKRNIARLGILRCSYFLNDHQTTINIANDIMSDPKSDANLKMEARYNRAKAYIALNQTTTAIADLKTLANDTRTENGAEAKYLLTNIYFEQNNLTDAENEVLDFAKKNTPYQFWLARSFIVLSDVYMKQNNDFQAKQYLLSLQKNYTNADEIQGMITVRLQAITAREQQTILN